MRRAFRGVTLGGFLAWRIEMTGRVKWFNEQRGYGFIVVEGGKDIFVHHNAIAVGGSLKEGDKVEFEVTQGPKGPQATNVRVVEPQD